MMNRRVTAKVVSADRLHAVRNVYRNMKTILLTLGALFALSFLLAGCDSGEPPVVPTAKGQPGGGGLPGGKQIPGRPGGGGAAAAGAGSSTKTGP